MSAPSSHAYRAAPAASVGGSLSVPGDKSISHRALLLGAIAEGQTRIRGFLASEDCLATLQALRALGVAIEQPAPDQVVITGVGMQGLRASAAALDMGNAGTAMRLFMGLLCGQTIRERTDRRLLLDAPADGTGGTAPAPHGCAYRHARRIARPWCCTATAELKAIDYAMPMASAQVKSAILLAALRAHGTTRVTEPAPTRDHTERMLEAFGVSVRPPRGERGADRRAAAARYGHRGAGRFFFRSFLSRCRLPRRHRWAHAAPCGR